MHLQIFILYLFTDNRANITSTVYYHDMPASTYYIYICGTERRNMICETLTVKIQGNPEYVSHG